MMEYFYLYVIAPVVAGLVGWFTGRRKQNAETKTDELANVTEAIKIWREMAEDFKTQLTEKDSALNDLKVQMQVITDQNKELLLKMTALEKDYSKLQKNYNDLKNNLKQ